jgi:hypothetical protein
MAGMIGLSKMTIGKRRKNKTRMAITTSLQGDNPNAALPKSDHGYNYYFIIISITIKINP